MNDWILLRLRRRDAEIWVEYEDDAGHRWPSPDEVITGPPADSSVMDVKLGKRVETVRIASDLTDRLASNLAELREQRGPHATGKSPLPLFVGGSMTVGTEEAERIVTEVVARAAPQFAGDVQLVRLSGDKWQKAPPLEFPLRIGWSGEEASRWLDLLREASWLDEVVGEYGLAFEEKEIKPRVGQPVDVLIVGFGVVAEEWTVTAEKRRSPRLLVTFNEKSAAHLRERRERRQPLLPAGVSLIDASAVPSSDRGKVVKSIIYGIIHDYAIHEVVKSAIRETHAPLTVYTDPLSNESLRLSDALMTLSEEVRDFSDVLAFDAKSASVILEQRRPEKKRSLRDKPAEKELAGPLNLDVVRKTVRDAVETTISMSEERGGIKPTSYVSRSVRAVRPYLDELRRRLASVRVDDPLRKKIYPGEERRVDIELMRRNMRDETLFVDKHRALETNGRYRVRVQIGRPGPNSIMVGDVPSIDTFLPPPDRESGHLLSIVLFPLDFKCSSLTIRQMTLPAQGSSEPVYFDIAAPKWEGKARLRIAIYYELPADARKKGDDPDRYHNQLVQSFIVEALVNSIEIWHPQPVTTSRLEVSRRVAFEGLETLKPRVASIGINESTPGTHTFMVKGKKAQGHIAVTEVAMQKALMSMRLELTALTDDGHGGPRFPETDLLERGGKRETEFDEAVRSLARKAYALHWSAWHGLDAEKRGVLDDIHDSHDKTVQIIRYNQSYVFPWSMLYDFDLPKEDDTQPSVEVCKGFLRQKGQDFITCGDCLGDCLHPDKSEAFCVWGFWGLRHRVEQLLHAEGKEEASISEVKPVREDAVRLTVGIEGFFAGKLSGDLSTLLGAKRVKDIVQPADVISTLWSAADRPAILIILGHYENHAKFGPRIKAEKQKWLAWNEIANRLKNKTDGKLSDPHPIVILAACESAAADLESFIDFVNLFGEARVGAVVGTETVIFDGLASRLAKNLASSLTSPDGTLGQAVLDFRRNVLRLLNPLGLVVTPYGDADLHLVNA